MVKKTKGKHRLDKFYHLAKEQGYRSRAAFKLVQLNRQFHFLDKARTCLDLCAAPGGWMQVAVKTMPLNSLVIGIDLDGIRPIKGAKSIIGDITTSKAHAAIRKESGNSMMEVVLHDGAPNVGGVWSSEAYSQSSLVLEALKLATHVLAPNGTFVSKVFRSQDYNALLFAFKQLFRKVDATKPVASRNTSAEIFVVCQGYKAPSKIDPRLLDAKHLFQDVAEAPVAVGPDALIRQKNKQKRFREGYEDGVSTLRRQTTAAAFVVAEQPVEMLGKYTSFSLVPEEEHEPERAGLAAFLDAHPSTEAEIRTLLADLQVLGRSEFKQLLKWRLKVKKEYSLAMAQPSGTEPGEEEAEKEKADPELAVLEEMQEVKDRVTQRERREKKRKRKLKKKARIRAAQLALAEGIGDQDGQETLFSLATIQGPVRAAEVGEVDAPDADAMESSASEAEAEEQPESDIDSDEEARRYQASVEEYLEEAYQQYKVKKGMHEARAKGKRARLADTEQADEADFSGEESPPAPEFQEDPEKGGGLLEDLRQQARQPKTAATVAAKWFSQDLFSGIEDEDDDSEQLPGPLTKRDSASPGASEKEVYKQPREAASLEDKATQTEAGTRVAAAGEYEEVPLSDGDSEGSSDTDVEEPDENTAAELRALGKAMLKGRRKNDILDSAYNRYVFYEENLPPWFADDQARYMRAPDILSRDEVQAEKHRDKAIDTRPIKKVAEAKARKKKRLQARLEQAKKKAGAILEQGDMSEQAKAKEVSSLYAKAKAGAKNSKKKPSRSDKYKKKGPPLDRRLYSDKRQIRHKSKLKMSKKGRGAKAGKKR